MSKEIDVKAEETQEDKVAVVTDEAETTTVSEPETEPVSQDEPNPEPSETEMPSEDDGDEAPAEDDAEDEEDEDDAEPDEEDDGSERVPGQSENFTKSPQDSEHVDLHGFPNFVRFARVYGPTSDDNGELLGDTELEAQVKNYINENINIKPEDVPDKEAFLEDARALTHHYFGAVNLAEAISIGVMTKYHIRLGALLNIQKKLTPHKKWEDYYNKYYDKTRRRSVQIWMQIAEVPAAIGYAGLSETRVLELVRAVKGYPPTAEDPIGDFLRKHRLQTDLENVESIKDFKIDIDTVLAKKKINDAAALNQVSFTVNTKLLKKWLRKGKEVNSSLISDLIMIKKADGEPNHLLRDLYKNSGSTIVTLTSEKTVTGFPKLVSQIKSTVEYIQENRDLVARIRTEDIEALEAQISTLKAMISSN